jgi:putative ABC transport system permease protein
MQLMNQISMGFMPVVLFGAALGGLVSLAGINSVLSVLFGSMGIMKMDFVIRSSWAVITTIIITVFSYGVSMFIAWRIRKISPYEVLTGE